MFQEVVIEDYLKPFETSKETAEVFKREHRAHAEVMEVPGSPGTTFTVRKGILTRMDMLSVYNDCARFILVTTTADHTTHIPVTVEAAAAFLFLRE